MEEAGGEEYLDHLVDITPTVDHIASYAAIVRDIAYDRGIRGGC